jgi:GGDEF domain-containing protein
MAGRWLTREDLIDEMSRRLESREPLDVVMLDVANFRSFNERFGDDFGHRLKDHLVTRMVAATPRHCILAFDPWVSWCIVTTHRPESASDQLIASIRARFSHLHFEQHDLDVQFHAVSLRSTPGEKDGRHIFVRGYDALFAEKKRLKALHRQPAS